MTRNTHVFGSVCDATGLGGYRSSYGVSIWSRIQLSANYRLGG